MLSVNGYADAAVEARIRIGWNKFTQLVPLLTNKDVSLRQFIRRQRPSDPWFDAECRDAKHRTPRLERAYAAANRQAASTTLMSKPSIDAAAAISKAAAAKAAWYAQRRTYRQLRHRKSTDFWHDKVASNESDP